MDMVPAHGALDASLRQVFRYINRYFMVPVFRLGLGGFMGNPFTGYIMVLQTTGRKSGRRRYAPVNYAILDGNVYCLAGFGHLADWYRNLRAQPEVELLMPGGAVAGRAEEVADPDEKLCAARQILKNGGFAGFAMGFNPFTVPDSTVRAALEGVPVICIRPHGVASGAGDPGGWLWVLVFAASVWPVWHWLATRKARR